jgi:hypothetical protein
MVSLRMMSRLAPTWGQVGLVDDEEIALGDAGAALARNLLACCHVDHVDGQIRQFGAEGGGQVVAARFDEDDVGIGEVLEHAVNGFQVDGGVSRIAVCGQPPVSRP